VEFDGMRILTDPIWSERSSPVSWFGPKRFFPPPLALEDVPELDVVLISHDHYDHLDMRTIEELSKRNVKFVMPLGVGAHLEAWGVRPENIVELNWYESVQLAELNITLVSARHFSGRHLVDRDRTLWGAFVVEGVNHKIFYAGDSGSSGCFEEIGEKYGPFDLAIMQIGAYSENWAEIHMTPEEALQAHLAVKGKLFLPVHWGTFNLAIHSWNDPAKRLAKAAQEMGIDFRIPQPGEFVYSDRDHSLPSDKWWSEE
jgi:L-ascorbate metabolism protein UlaG (beta-lactamase superfamily)